MTYIRVESSLFSEFPTFRRGILVGTRSTMPIDEEAVVQSLRSILDPLSRESIKGQDALTSAWTETFALLGYSPLPYLRLISRISNDASSDQSTFWNWVWRVAARVAQYLGLPVGVYDLELTQPGVELARVNRIAALLNSVEENHGLELEKPSDSEVIFLNRTRGFFLCRKWNLEIARLEDDSRRTSGFLVTVDSIGSGSDSITFAALDLMTQVLAHICSGPVAAGVLDPETTAYQIIGPRPHQIDPGLSMISLAKCS